MLAPNKTEPKLQVRAFPTLRGKQNKLLLTQRNL